MPDPPVAAPAQVAGSGQDVLLATKPHVPPPPPGFVPRPRLVMALINELAADPGPDEVLLVLDDYHLADSGPVHESVAFLLENLPPGPPPHWPGLRGHLCPPLLRSPPSRTRGLPVQAGRMLIIEVAG